MSKYQNETYTKGQSDFIRVDTVDGTKATFTSKVSPVKTLAGSVSLTAGHVRVSRPKSIVSACEACVTADVSNSVDIKFNVIAGDIASLTALRTECDRLFDMFVNQYNGAVGLVPPSYATLEVV